jgi:hypothetical protein
MKVNPRNTATRVLAKRITAPETQTDHETGKKILLLSYVDQHSNHRHDRTSREIFLYAAGNNEEGEMPDGLDRLSDHQFVIHKDEKGKAIGIDVIPARLYRSGVVPVSQEGVKTLIVQYDLDGAVCRVIQRPFNTRAEQSMRVINELDKLIKAGKSVHTAMKLGNVGTVVNTTDNTVEVRLRSGQRVVTGSTPVSAEDMAEEAVEG